MKTPTGPCGRPRSISHIHLHAKTEAVQKKEGGEELEACAGIIIVNYHLINKKYPFVQHSECLKGTFCTKIIAAVPRVSWCCTNIRIFSFISYTTQSNCSFNDCFIN